MSPQSSCLALLLARCSQVTLSYFPISSKVWRKLLLCTFPINALSPLNGNLLEAKNSTKVPSFFLERSELTISNVLLVCMCTCYYISIVFFLNELNSWKLLNCHQCREMTGWKWSGNNFKNANSSKFVLEGPLIGQISKIYGRLIAIKTISNPDNF